jgi:CheY-like chemotaxis protein
VNQLVAVGLLENAGYVTDVVEDGVDAVNALRPGHDYAAVLMDCRMPRLDGFDATRVIRISEPEGERVPIIAMTASALEGERQRCLEAGMDDFLTKPVDPVRLVRVVRQWIEDGVGHAAPPLEADRDPWPGEGIDLDRMRMLDLLRRDGESLLYRSAANFTAHAPVHLSDLQAAVAGDDPVALVQSAHRVSGSATNLGLVALGEAAAAIEQLGDTGSTEGADRLLDTLARELDRALAILTRVLTDGP